MSFVDLDKVTPEDLILHFVLECRGKGHFLPYQDYQIIEDWLKATSDPDDLLLILSEVLPPFFRGESLSLRPGAAKKSEPRSLSGARNLVLRRLRDRAMRRVPE